MLAKANSRINERMLTSAFANFTDWDPFSRRLGLWFFNTHSRCYTFLPFYYGLGSPYGSYNTSVYYPTAYYPQRYPNGNTNGNPQTGSNNGGGHTYPSGNGGGGGGTRPAQPPPTPAIAPPSGGFGSGRERIPDMETGRPMPRKNIESSRPNQ